MRNKDKTNTMPYPYPPWLNFPSSEGSTSHQGVQKDWELGEVRLGQNSCPYSSYLSRAPVGPPQATVPVRRTCSCVGPPLVTILARNHLHGLQFLPETSPCSCGEPPEVPFLPCGAITGPTPVRRICSCVGPAQATVPAGDRPPAPAPPPRHLHQP